MKKLLLVLSCLVTLSLTAQNRFTGAGSWREIFNQAAAHHKMVIIDCYFEGCHPCKQMDEEVFPHPEVSRLMDSAYIGIKTDVLKEPFGKQLQIKYGITGFPTYLIFTSDGQLVDYFSGYKEADRFARLLRTAAVSAQSGHVLKGFAPGLDVDYPAFYSAYFKERKAYSAEQLNSYLEENKERLQPPFTEAAIMPLLMTRSLSGSLSDFMLNNYNKLEERFGKGLAGAQRMRIVQELIAAAPTQADGQWLDSFLAKMKTYSNDRDWPYFELDIAEAYYVNHLKDPGAFFTFAATHLNDDDNKVRYMGMRLSAPTTTPEQKALYLSWALKVLSPASSQDALEAAAGVLLTENRKEEATRLAGWALAKAKQNNRDPGGSQQILDKLHSEN